MKMIRWVGWLAVCLAISGFASAQEATPAAKLPSEMPEKFTAVTDSFDYVKGAVMTRCATV